MEAGIKKLMRVPRILCNYKVVSNYMVHFFPKSHSYCSYAEDTALPKKLDSYKNNTKQRHYTDIKSYTLPILSEIKTVANENEALSMIAKIVDDVKSNPNDTEITKTQEFINLCNVVLKGIRQYPIADIIRLLKYATLLKIPADTYLMQSILQMLRVNINELTVHELPFVYFLLEKQEPTELGKALREAIPYAVEIQLKSCPKNITIQSALILLNFACRYSNQNTVNMCVHLVKELMEDPHNTITPAQYTNVYYSLSNIESPTSDCIKLLIKVQKDIKANMAHFTAADIYSLINAVYIQFRKSNIVFTERFIDMLCNAVIQHNAHFETCISILRKLTKMNLNNICLLDYVAGMSFAKGHLQNANLSDILCFINALATVDYKPVFWDHIKKIILERNISDLPLQESQLKFAIILTALDCYYPDLIKKTFTFDRETLQSNTESMQLLLELYQSVKTLYPTYKGPFPSNVTIEYIKSLKRKNEEIPLKLPLGTAVGGLQYLMVNLRTYLGHIIDYAVIMGSNGQPISLRSSESCNSTSFIEDIKIPPDSQMILIFNFPREAYSNNLGRLNSRWQLILKSVEALTGHNTLAINSWQWCKLPDFEKVPYLAQAIRLKCDNCVAGKPS